MRVASPFDGQVYYASVSSGRFRCLTSLNFEKQSDACPPGEKLSFSSSWFWAEDPNGPLSNRVKTL